jgi:hypothetical protein
MSKNRALHICLRYKCKTQNSSKGVMAAMENGNGNPNNRHILDSIHMAVTASVTERSLSNILQIVIFTYLTEDGGNMFLRYAGIYPQVISWT